MHPQKLDIFGGAYFYAQKGEKIKFIVQSLELMLCDEVKITVVLGKIKELSPYGLYMPQ